MNLSQSVPLLLVSDIEKTRDFYCDGLGFHVQNEWTPGGALSWCWLAQGSAAIMLQKACQEDPPQSSWPLGVTIYFICDDADVAYSDIVGRGIEATPPTETFYKMRQTFVTDPDGYKICFENPVE